MTRGGQPGLVAGEVSTADAAGMAPIKLNTVVKPQRGRRHEPG